MSTFSRSRSFPRACPPEVVSRRDLRSARPHSVIISPSLDPFVLLVTVVRFSISQSKRSTRCMITSRFHIASSHFIAPTLRKAPNAPMLVWLLLFPCIIFSLPPRPGRRGDCARAKDVLAQTVAIHVYFGLGLANRGAVSRRRAEPCPSCLLCVQQCAPRRRRPTIGQSGTLCG